jgi:hypothetical protein
MKKLYQSLPFFLTIFLSMIVVYLFLSSIQMSANIEEPFIGRHIRPHIRTARLTAENYLGEYGTYGMNLLRKKGIL